MDDKEEADEAYKHLANFIKKEMKDKLKLGKSNANGNNHTRNKCPKKPYWNETLSCKWNTVCEN